MKSQDLTHEHEQIKYLESVPDSYMQATLPCLADERIQEIVSETMNGTLEQRKEIYRAITSKASGALQLFAERMAMLSVRKNSPDLLRKGLVAMTMVNSAKPGDDRILAIRMSLLHHSAQKLGLNVEAFFEQSSQYMSGISLTGGAPAAFLRRTPKNKRIQAMGYDEIEGPSGLIYTSPASIAKISGGLLYENEPLIPDDVEGFFTGLGASIDNTAKIALYFDIKKNVKSQSQLEDKLVQLLQSGSHDSRVVLALGGLGVKGAVDVLRNHLSSDTGDFLGHFLIDVALALWWIEQSSQALQFIVDKLAQKTTPGIQISAVIALKYFECSEAVKALKMALDDGTYNVRFYALKTLIALCDPSKVAKRPLLAKMGSPIPQVQQEVLVELDNLINQRVFPDCQDSAHQNKK